LSLAFYRRDPVAVARALLGKRLVTVVDGRLTSGRIVETEAYLANGDSASHGAVAPTRRNAVMFGRAGIAYVYAIHSRWCFNVVTERPGLPSAVLIRALEPLEGIDVMIERRGTQRLLDLARGPARLCEALGIDRMLNGADLTLGATVWIESAGPRIAATRIRQTPRIGVTSAHDLELRFVIAGHPLASGPRYLR